MNRFVKRIPSTVLLGACLLPVGVQGAESDAKTVQLVERGSARASIILPGEPDELEQLAADELVEHVEKISGARLPIITEKQTTGGTKIHIGRAAPDAGVSKQLIRVGGDDPASFRLLVTDRNIQLVGLSPQGSLIAAYELLEQLGVRWFVPGEIGTVIPKTGTVAVRHQDTIQRPGFRGRILTDVPNRWFQRMRMGGFNAGGHGPGWRSHPDKEPELFMIEDGRRTGKLNLSHPEVFRRTMQACLEELENDPSTEYVSVGPYDGHGFGVHPWDAHDMDPLHGRVSVTDRYVKFFNLLLAELRKQHPNVGLAFYCYSQHMRAPVREKPDTKILPILAPIDVCRIHAIDNPFCWERQYIRQIVEDWKALDVRMMYRGYLFHLADAGIPFSMIRQVRAEYPYYHRLGMIACRVECKPAWAYHGPSLYLASRIMWDPSLNADALLDDYFTKFYGPAAEPMRSHFDRLERAYREADYHTGNVFDIPHILIPRVMLKLGSSLQSAEQAVPDESIFARRVHMTRVGFDFGVEHLKMMSAVNNLDFSNAREHRDKILGQIVPEAFEHDPVLLSRRYGSAFIRRFWNTTVQSGYERITNGNEVVARLPDEWLFMLDPFDGGEALGLWKPGIGTGSWRPLKTWSRSWSNQGLRYYKAQAWYRTTAKVDNRFRGRSIRLWLGGVDESAKAWINGRELKRVESGLAPIGRPWEFDATEAIRFGQSNLIVVKISNRQLSELGTGGITGPAMLWAAKGEK